MNEAAYVLDKFRLFCSMLLLLLVQLLPELPSVVVTSSDLLLQFFVPLLERAVVGFLVDEPTLQLLDAAFVTLGRLPAALYLSLQLCDTLLNFVVRHDVLFKLGSRLCESFSNSARVLTSLYDRAVLKGGCRRLGMSLRTWHPLCEHFVPPFPPSTLGPSSAPPGLRHPSSNPCKSAISPRKRWLS